MNQQPKKRLNKYTIHCWRCHYSIAPGKGFVWKEGPDLAWVGEHQECPEDGGDNPDDELRWDQTWG